MSIDWKLLETKTKNFRTLKINRDPGGLFAEAIFSGFQVKLSEIEPHFPVGGGSSLTIFADTLIVDTPVFDAQGVVVMARNLDLSLFAGSPALLRVPSTDQGMAIGQFLIQGAGGATFKLMTDQATSEAGAFTIPMGENPLQVLNYIVNADGTTSHNIETDATSLQDLVGGILSLNTLKSSFTAASWLMNSEVADDRATAQSMLSWVTACIHALGKGATVPGDFAELYNQAAALLVTLNVATGTYYVPVLSSEFYKNQVDGLLNTAQSYEDKLDTLNVQGDIQKAVEDVSQTLQGVAQDETVPLQTDLNNIEQNLENLRHDVQTLQSQFEIQQLNASGKFVLLQNAILTKKVDDFLNAAVNMVFDIANIGVSAAKLYVGDPSGIKDAAEAAKASAEAVGNMVEGVQTLVTTAQNAKKMIAGITSPPPGGQNLLTQANQLIQAQVQLMSMFQASAVMWNDAKTSGGMSAVQLPTTLGSVSIDPSLAWDNFMIQVEAQLTSLKDSLTSGSNVAKVQSAANQYLASLKILAQYGKAINAKYVAYSQQFARASVVNAQIQAAQSIESRWSALSQQAKSEEEKLGALKGIIQTRMDAIKRSVYTAWIYYRNSYFHLYFKNPPVTINIDMSVAEFKEAFVQVSSWVQRLIGDVPENQKIRLPDDSVTIPLEFSIVRQDADIVQTDTALLTPAKDQQPATITWSIPIGTQQLKGLLPSGGNVAIWIKEAKFFLDGMQPNSRGRVLAKVSTSGTYSNGFGPSNTYSFVSKGLEGNYGYILASSSVYDPWDIDTTVYMTPTLYTQWTMVFDQEGGDPNQVTTLHMDLTVSYREAN